MDENKQLKEKELKDVNGAYINKCVKYFYTCNACGGTFKGNYKEKKCKYCGSTSIKRSEDY